MTRIVFLGTPDAAVPTLDAVAEEHEVVLAVTQPDRPRGRSGAPRPTPVKLAAERRGIPVSQPRSAPELIEALDGAGPIDVGVVVAYGRILRPEALSVPAAGMLNVHFSLLPRWRGAAPVARALMAGDEMTGVTIIALDEGLDTGPVLTAQAVDVEEGENAGELTDRLAQAGARLIVSVIDPFLRGSLVPVPQTSEGATYASKIEPADRPLGRDLEPGEFAARVQGLAPRPGATLAIDGSVHKILAAQPSSERAAAGTWRRADDRVLVGLDGGAVEILTLQPPGKTPQAAADWARGRRRSEGKVG